MCRMKGNKPQIYLGVIWAENCKNNEEDSPDVSQRLEAYTWTGHGKHG